MPASETSEHSLFKENATFADIGKTLLQESLRSLLDNSTPEEIELLENKLAANNSKALFTSIMNDFTTDIAEQYFNDLIDAMPTLLADNKKANTSFSSEVETKWKEPLGYLEALIEISQEIGGDFCKNTNGFYEANEIDTVSLYAALLALHSRACRTANEILLLLKNGYGQGAMARWRALHELNITATFLNSYPEVVPLWWEHRHVDIYKQAVTYNECAPLMDFSTLEMDYLDELKEKKEELREAHGKEFVKLPYGWAYKKLTELNHPTSFDGLEKAVEQQKWRAYYKMACDFIHTSSKNVTFNPDNHAPNEVYLVGASSKGLAEPGQCTCLSLSQITILLLVCRPHFLSSAFGKVVLDFSQKGVDCFTSIDKAPQS